MQEIRRWAIDFKKGTMWVSQQSNASTQAK